MPSDRAIAEASPVPSMRNRADFERPVAVFPVGRRGVPPLAGERPAARRMGLQTRESGILPQRDAGGAGLVRQKLIHVGANPVRVARFIVAAGGDEQFVAMRRIRLKRLRRPGARSS